MNRLDIDELILQRMIKDSSLPLWQDGPSLRVTLDKFSQHCAEHARIDSWIPFCSSGTQIIFSWFLKGAAFGLADRLKIHRKVATLALLFSVQSSIFSSNSLEETTELILNSVDPVLDGESKYEGFHLLGAKAIGIWLDRGLIGKPPTQQIDFIIKAIDENAVDAVRNPNGLADVAADLLAVVGLPKK